MASIIDLDVFFEVSEGFCYPDWGRVGDWICEGFPEENWNKVWLDVARDWVGKIREMAGICYQIHETANFLIMTDAPLLVVRDIGRTCEEGLRMILEQLEGVASDEGYGKHVVMLFSEDFMYYRYLAYFYPEG